MPDYSLINPGELTRPVTVLIEKISNAVGTLVGAEADPSRRASQGRRGDDLGQGRHRDR